MFVGLTKVSLRIFCLGYNLTASDKTVDSVYIPKDKKTVHEIYIKTECNTSLITGEAFVMVVSGCD
jgi:hypothetical protein